MSPHLNHVGVRPLARALALYALLAAASLFVMLNVHEIGHTVFARLFGDSGASYALYRLHPDGRVACIGCIGCNVYDETKISPFGNSVVALGGLIFSQGLALALLWSKSKTKKSWLIGRFIDVLIAVCVFDAVFQVAQGIIVNTAQQTAFTRVDMADFIWLVTRQTQVSPVAVKGLVLIALLVYLRWFIRIYRKMTVANPN